MKLITTKPLVWFVVLAILSTSLTSCAGSKPSSHSARPDRKIQVSSEAEKAVNEARTYIGTKYHYGGTTRKGIDCSGLTMVSYQSAGVQLPRSSSAQSSFGKRVYIGELEVGDLVFFSGSPSSKKITHVGIISDVSKESIKFIHASSSRGVTESELLSKYYRPRYVKAIRPTS